MLQNSLERLCGRLRLIGEYTEKFFWENSKKLLTRLLLCDIIYSTMRVARWDRSANYGLAITVQYDRDPSFDQNLITAVCLRQGCTIPSWRSIWLGKHGFERETDLFSINRIRSSVCCGSYFFIHLCCLRLPPLWLLGPRGEAQRDERDVWISGISLGAIS